RVLQAVGARNTCRHDTVQRLRPVRTRRRQCRRGAADERRDALSCHPCQWLAPGTFLHDGRVLRVLARNRWCAESARLPGNGGRRHGCADTGRCGELWLAFRKTAFRAWTWRWWVPAPGGLQRRPFARITGLT